jgi:hypothetical protein
MILGGAIGSLRVSQSLRPFEFVEIQNASGGQRQVPKACPTTVFGPLLAARSRFMVPDPQVCVDDEARQRGPGRREVVVGPLIETNPSAGVAARSVLRRS